MTESEWFVQISLPTPNLQKVRQLAQKYSKLYNEDDKTALMLISATPNSPIFQILLLKELKMQNKSDYSAIFSAVKSNNHAYIQPLKAEANFSVNQNFEGIFKSEMPIQLAARLCHFSCVKELLKWSPKSNFSENFLKSAQHLPAKVEKFTDSNGRTQLMYYAMNPAQPLDCDYLAHQQGIIDDSGFSALMYAVLAKNLKFIEFAVQNLPKELKLQTVEKFEMFEIGSTALHLAVIGQDFEAVKILKNFELGIENQSGKKAWELCSGEIAELLIEEQTVENVVKFNKRSILDRNLQNLTHLYSATTTGATLLKDVTSTLNFSGIHNNLTLEANFSSISMPATSRKTLSANEILKELSVIVGQNYSNFGQQVREQLKTYNEEMILKEQFEKLKNAEELDLMEEQKSIVLIQEKIVAETQKQTYLKELLVNQQNLEYRNQCEQINGIKEQKGIETIKFNKDDFVDKETQNSADLVEKFMQTNLQLEEFSKFYELFTTIQESMNQIQKQTVTLFKNFHASKLKFKQILNESCEKMEQSFDIEFKLKKSTFENQTDIPSNLLLSSVENQCLSPKRLVIDVQTFYNEKTTLNQKQEHFDKIYREKERLKQEKDKLLLQIRQIDNSLLQLGIKQ